MFVILTKITYLLTYLFMKSGPFKSMTGYVTLTLPLCSAVSLRRLLDERKTVTIVVIANDVSIGS